MYYNLRKRIIKLSRKQLTALITVIVLVLVCVAFAAWQTKFEINGAVAYRNPNWDLHFENLEVDSGSVTTANPATISEDKRRITFSVSLSNQNDYYQFETDIVNDGLIDAMVSDAKIIGLPTNLKDYIDCKLTYSDDSEIKNNDALRVGSSERIKARIELKKGININSLPSNEAIELVLEIFYIKATDVAVDKKQNYLFDVSKAVLDNVKSEFVSSSTGIDFGQISSNTNGAGLYIRNGTEKSRYPIYYYRGAVTNNNIIYANFCWKIVRTTETGGVKLIYNGTITSGNTCKNTTEAITQLSTQSAFNNIYDNRKYVGYMYDTNTSSTVKEVIDNWFLLNIQNKGYSEYLEDTVWCSDRTSASGPASGVEYFGAFERIYTQKSPSLVCQQDSDKYTVKPTSNVYNASLNGNKLLDYPVALLTGDEAMMAGAIVGTENKTFYLFNGQNFWLLSPWFYASKSANVIVMWSGGYMGIYSNTGVGSPSGGIRPSVSLKAGTKVTTSGTGEAGTSTNPYIVVES